MTHVLHEGHAHIVCPDCGVTNRAPINRPVSAARCGSCRKQLFDGRAIDVDASDFARHREWNDIAVLVDIWAPWCGPCRTMAPNYERAAVDLEPSVRLLKLNAGKETALSRELGLNNIPALILFKRGIVVARTDGAMPTRQIVAWTKENLAKAA